MVDAQNDSRSVAGLLKAVPYCRHLGIDADVQNGRVKLIMPFVPHLVGNPMLPALHGGVIGSLLESAAIAQVMFDLGAESKPRPVDITIDYLRSGRAVASYAQARIAKQGRRVVNVHAEMWQEDETKPIAALRGHFLISTPA
jgi:uncharacterized protein (TIGR00369 family)